MRLRRPPLSWQAWLVFVLGCMTAAFIWGLHLADERGSQRVDVQKDTTSELAATTERLRLQIVTLENENKALRADLEKARAQANTSVEQLTQAGQKPIIAAPDVVSVPLEPSRTTTTAAPAPIVVVPPTTTTSTTSTSAAPPPTEPPSTSTTTTEPPEPTTTEAPTTTSIVSGGQE